ncbi:MAG: zf-HC2 domain-containing protein [Acidobacteriota bacterium]
MNCNRCEQLLDEYIAETLSSDQVQTLEQHLEACKDCSSSLDELRSLLSAAAKLPRQITPEHDLWPGISRRIESSGVTRPRHHWRQTRTIQWLPLAAVLGLLVIGLWFSSSLTERRSSDRDFASKTRLESSQVPITALVDQARSEDGTMQARIDLIGAVEQRRDVLDEETLRVIEANRLLLEQAIGEIRGALGDQPENRRLKLALAARYQQEIRFLQHVSRV